MDLANSKANISDLKYDKRNARRHTPRNVGMVEHSIQRDGFGRSILVANDGTIIAGNATVEAAASAGIENVIVVESDGKSIIAVKRTDIEPGSPEFTALAISDNRAAELAEWDAEVLQSFMDDGVDLDQFWFEDELDLLLNGEDDEPMGGNTDPDEVPDVPSDPVTKRGDLWLLGRHRLLCGDSTVVTDVDRLMDGAKADMVFTDPPYGMNLDTDFDQMFTAHKSHRKTGDRFDRVIGDDEVFRFADFAWLDAPEQFWWGADYYCQQLPEGGGWFVWDKRTNEQMDKALGNVFELCWSRQRHKREVIRELWSGHHGMQKDDTRTRVHPTQKPVVLPVWFIDRFSKPSHTILDLFLGSGSTLIACEQTGRTCYGMELDPHYCDVIVKRWENFTGETAVLVTDDLMSSGKPRRSTMKNQGRKCDTPA